MVEQCAVRIEHLGDGSLEQLLLALEVVVERAHPDVGGLGDLQDRDIDLARGDECLSRRDQCGAGALFAPLEAIDGRYLTGSATRLTVAESLSFEDFVRNCLTERVVVCDDFVNFKEVLDERHCRRP